MSPTLRRMLCSFHGVHPTKVGYIKSIHAGPSADGRNPPHRPPIGRREKLDFTGSYALSGIKGGMKMEKGSNWTLKTIQGDTEIEITKIMDGKADNYKVRLDGTEAMFISPSGARGSCTARLKGKALMLETVVSGPPPAGRSYCSNTQERALDFVAGWQHVNYTERGGFADIRPSWFSVGGALDRILYASVATGRTAYYHSPSPRFRASDASRKQPQPRLFCFGC